MMDGPRSKWQKSLEYGVKPLLDGMHPLENNKISH